MGLKLHSVKTRIAGATVGSATLWRFVIGNDWKCKRCKTQQLREITLACKFQHDNFEISQRKV